MVNKDIANFDASNRASSELEYVIKSDKKSQNTVPTVSAKEAMSGERLFRLESSRNATRVLFISQDTELLNPAKQSLDGYVDISSLFDEVHILILRTGIAPKKPVLRVSKNVWIYTASSQFWWLTPSEGIEVAENQLEFAGGFRPDLIVARDPFESAVVAMKLSEKYNKPAQLHVIEDYSTPQFLRENRINRWRLFILPFYLPKFDSIRTNTDSLKDIIAKNYNVSDLEVLPRYQNYEQLAEGTEQIDLKSIYKPHIFFMLYVGVLNKKSNLGVIIDAISELLRNPRLCLIVIGDGSHRKEFEKKAKTLGLLEQIIFLGDVKDHTPYLRSANVLMVGDTDFASEELVMQGASVGIPMVMASTEKREDIFKNGESAFICGKNDVWVFQTAVNQLLNSVSLRRQISMASKEIIKQDFYKDPKEYMFAYRDSIEKAFFVGQESEETELT